jgi:hypothetical protein
MRGLLLFGVVGAAIYALLLATHKVIPDPKPGDNFAGQAHPNQRHLRSWGSDLPALVTSSASSPQQNAAHAPRESKDNSNQNSARNSGAGDQLAADDEITASRISGAEQEHIEWAQVMHAARVHSEASVSSPTTRFYRPGTDLQVVRRENGWLHVLDPVTQERGGIFEKYLSSIDGPGHTQAAGVSPIEDELSQSIPSKPVSSARKRSRSAKPAAHKSDGVITKADLSRRRWARHGDRRRGFGLFMSRRSARFDASPR